MNEYYNNYDYRKKQDHTHEYMGTTEMAELGTKAHNHRMAGISGEAINVTGGHVHEITTETTFEDNHIHHARVRTGLQIPVGDNKHVHLIKGLTTIEDNHNHNFLFTTQVE